MSTSTVPFEDPASTDRAGTLAASLSAEALGSGKVDPAQIRVLVVDDSPMNVEILSKSLEGLGYVVDSACSGRAALDRIDVRHPDVVLLDIVMPEISGKEVLRRIRANPETSDLPVILVSGLDDTQDIVEGLELGANDYVTKPINLPVLQARLATQTALKRARDDLKRNALLLAAEIDHNARELQVAAQVQRSILPRAAPRFETLSAAWCYEPASRVGGDLVDIIPLSRNRTLLFIADAMGHGVQAALVVSALKATLAAQLHEADNLAILMGLLDLAVGDMFEDRYVTAAVCVVDPPARRLRYALAGHPPILVAGPSGVEKLSTAGLPLGTHLGLTFESSEVVLEPGAAVLLYSDGVIEAEGPDGQQFGITRLIETFRTRADREPEEAVSAIRQAVDTFRGALPLRDDLTILVGRVPRHLIS